MDQPRVVVRRRDAVEPAGGGIGLVRIGRHRAAVQRRGETSGQVAHGVVGGHERWHAAIEHGGVAGGSGEAAHARECQRSVGADPADERAPSRLGVDPQIGGRLFLPGLLDVGVEVTVQRPRPAGGERGQIGAQHPQNGPVARDDQLPPSRVVDRCLASQARGDRRQPGPDKPPTVCRPVAVSRVRPIARQTKSTKLMLAYTPLASGVSSKNPRPRPRSRRWDRSPMAGRCRRPG